MKSTVFFSFFLLLCICNKVQAQSVYLFKYYVTDGEDSVLYKAFFEREEDGRGFMRVGHTDTSTKQEVLVDFDTEENYYSDPDKPEEPLLLYFKGREPEVVRGDPDSRSNRPLFWFKRNDNDSVYDPIGVTTQKTDSLIISPFTEVKLLTREDLTQELVMEFFENDEPFYQNLFQKAKTRRTSVTQKPITLHLLIVANTEDNSIGATCTKDKDRTLKAYKELTEYLKIQFDPTTVFGSTYSKASVDKALQSLDPSPNDIVVFYYSGHGFNYPNDSHQYPYLDLRPKDYMPLENNTLNIEDVYYRIKKKGARLSLVLSDCCNAQPEASSSITSNVAQTRGASLGWSLENCMALFLNEQPVHVLSTAATKGELSAGNDNIGGIFTFNFSESLQSSLGLFYRNVSWDNVLQQAQSQTIKKAARTLCPQADEKSFGPCVQHPVYKLEQK